METGVVVRTAVIDDVGAVTDIYNATVLTSTVAWTDAPDSVESRRAWFDARRAAGHAVVVATVDDDVVGFAAYGDFRDSAKWPGYRFTVEHTIHVADGHRGAGIGEALMNDLVARAASAGLHAMVGGIDADNAGSIRFHRRLGFVEVARMPEVGFKFGRWLDLVLVQRTLGE
jgi:L-amino acid N-acyltransferase